MAVQQRPGFSFLVCPDSELLKQKLDSLLTTYPANGSAWEKKVFWGDEEADSEFWESLTQQSLFAAPRAVVVRNAEQWPAAVWQGISKVLARGSSSVWPVFCLEVGMEKNAFKIPLWIKKLACFRHAEKAKWLWTQPQLARSNLEKYAREEAGRLGLRFADGACEEFCSSVNPEALAIHNELLRLALVASDGEITPSMISQGGASPESNAFVIVQRLMAGNLTGAWQEMAGSSANSLLFFLMALLERELRVLWELAAGSQVRLYPAEATRKRELARRLGFSGIATGFAALADAEWQVKSGADTPDQAMEYLMSRIGRLFARKT